MVQINIDMPKTCRWCFCFDETYQQCPLIPGVPAMQKDVEEFYKERRSKYCPLINVNTSFVEEGLNPERDVNEEESHFCNSLNATFGFLRHMVSDPNCKDIDYIPVKKDSLRRMAAYGERAQACIMYLQKQLRESEEKK